MWNICKPIRPGIVPPEIIAPPQRLPNCANSRSDRSRNGVKPCKRVPGQPPKPRPVKMPETMRPGSSFGGAHKKPDRLIKVPVKLPPKLELIKKPYC